MFLSVDASDAKQALLCMLLCSCMQREVHRCCTGIAGGCVLHLAGVLKLVFCVVHLVCTLQPVCAASSQRDELPLSHKDELLRQRECLAQSSVSSSWLQGPLNVVTAFTAQAASGLCRWQQFSGIPMMLLARARCCVHFVAASMDGRSGQAELQYMYVS